jgi:diaminopimelate decarboxylase
MPAILRRVRAAGMGAEAISGAEVDTALAAGFTREQVVLGGVAKAWPSGTIQPGLLALLHDTLEGFHGSVLTGGHRFHCVRLRFPDVGSRLGYDTSPLDRRQELASALLHAHARGVSVGLATHEHNVPAARSDTWFARVRSMLDGLAEVNSHASAAIECFDLGGGYNEACLDELLWGNLGAELLAYFRERLPRCSTVILEPGKSLVQAYGAVVATVLARQSPDEVCVDASMAELPWPMAHRPVFKWRHEQGWVPLGKGTGLVGGRCTAETDVLATAVDVTDLAPGDRVLFADAGAYDWSMRSAFGTGTVVETIVTADADSR